MSLLLLAEAWGLSFFWVPGYPPNSFENFEVFIPMEMNRRTLAKGAAWAAPVVVASAAVPAYAASQEPCSTGGSFIAPPPSDENGATSTWTVPAGVTSICFTVLGGAGGGFGTTPGGAGAKVTGILPVSPGDQLTLVVGSGGVSNQASWARTFGTAPATGGKGYGNGGDSAPDMTGEPNQLSGKNGRVQRIGASGGAGSAILLNGQPVVIAGGGGGAGLAPTFASIHEQREDPENPGKNIPVLWKGQLTSNTNNPAASNTTSVQQAGSAGGSAADASGVTLRTTTARAAVAGETISFGSGAKAGVAGVGGASGPNDGTYIGVLKAEVNDYMAGGNGESVSAPGPAKGGSGVAVDSTARTFFKAEYEADGTLAKPEAWLTVRVVNSGGGGGGGYGGGGAGSAKNYQLTYTGTPFIPKAEDDPVNGNGNPDPEEYSTAFSVGNAGAAGGSYVASSVTGGVIAQGSNANSTGGTRNHGAISFTF